MKKLIILIGIFLMLYSCDKPMNSTSRLTKVVHNNTNKQIVYTIETCVGEKTIISSKNNSDSVVFENNYVIMLPAIGAYQIPYYRVEVYNEYIYNISDTSKYIFRSRSLATVNDSIFWSHIYCYDAKNSTVNDEIYTEKLTLDDNILSLLQKDYTMLDKFKDYYKR
jgi:hypothetical protein